MREFVVSDLHGQPYIYQGIIDYLRRLKEDVTLYINGDIIDRGLCSIELIKSIMNPEYFDIVMLAGNHELMMLDSILDPENNSKRDLWTSFPNSGNKTCKDYYNLSDNDRELLLNFLKKLKISILLDKEIMGYKGTILTHAFPMKNFNNLDKTLNDAIDEYALRAHLWCRETDLYYYETLGVENYLNIIGHTPHPEQGFGIRDNVVCIDGGAAFIPLLENKELVNTPLVELDYKNNCLNLQGFNYWGQKTYNKRILKQDGKLISK